MKTSTIRKIRRIKEDVRVFIVKAISVIAAITLILSICCIESESYIPYITLAVSMIWLSLVGYANRNN